MALQPKIVSLRGFASFELSGLVMSAAVRSASGGKERELGACTSLGEVGRTWETEPLTGSDTVFGRVIFSGSLQPEKLPAMSKAPRDTTALAPSWASGHDWSQMFLPYLGTPAQAMKL